MKARLLVLFVLLALLGVLTYELVQIELRYLRPRVVQVERPVVREVLGTVTRETVERALDSLRVFARARDEHLEILQLRRSSSGRQIPVYRPVFVKGINLGAALPGHYPAEFPATDQDYLRWFRQMTRAGFNVVRVYTVFPPAFYSALATYNLQNRNRPLYLLQGIWVPVPEQEDYLDPDFSRRIQLEIERAVNAVYGGGEYFSDVSSVTLGFLFGREWEPEGVRTTQEMHPDLTSYQGFFVSLPYGTPMEVWLARMLDYLQTYEVVRYHGLHPVAFVNWLPLDPLYHNTEWIESDRVREYDNDLWTLDPSHFSRTARNPAGLFAAYHVYPYYPDFVNLEYLQDTSRFGPDNYAGYLRALHEATDGLPLVVAEFGVPSSRGIAHFNPLGLHQGGHTEEQQGRLDARLFQVIYDEGLAGGILFAWMDEWFKRNWLVMDFENPLSRNPLWHNVYDPEQTYGLVGFDPRDLTVDGQPEDWPEEAAFAHGQGIRRVYLHADPAYLWIRVDLARPFQPETDTLWLFLDTYRADLGEVQSPRPPWRLGQGAEFALCLAPPGRTWVTEPYQVFQDWIQGIRSPMRPAAVDTAPGRWVEPALLANRSRITLLGDTVPEQRFYPGRLIFAPQQENTLADWFARDTVVELRLGWNLIHITDPSSHRVLLDDPGTPELDATPTEGIALALLWVRQGQVLGVLPSAHGNRLNFTRRYRWPGWDQPTYEEHLKASYQVLQAFLPRLERDSSRRVTRLQALRSRARTLEVRLTPFPRDARGFVSVTFDYGSLGQIRYALPRLAKYGVRASFGLVPENLQSPPRRRAVGSGPRALRFAREHLLDLLHQGHEGALQGPLPPEEVPWFLMDSLKNLGLRVEGLHWADTTVPTRVLQEARRRGLRWIRRLGPEPRSATGGSGLLTALPLQSDTHPSPRAVYRYLRRARGRWAALAYRRVVPLQDPEARLPAREDARVDPFTLERHLRLARNLHLALWPPSAAGRYLANRQRARLQVSAQPRLWVLTLSNTDQPLWVELVAPPGLYRVHRSRYDGVYEVRRHPVYLLVPPDQPVLVERLTP